MSNVHIGADSSREIDKCAKQQDVYTPPSVVEVLTRKVVVVPPTVFGYARYSTSTQRESSIERQEESIREYAARNGYVVKKIFVDAATTGTVAGRQGMSDLLDACRSCKRSVVVVENVDRFVRDMYAYADLILKFHDCSTELHDMSGHNSPTVEAIKASIASEDRSRMLARMASGRLSSIRAGRFVGTRVPYGYMRTARATIEIDPDTAPHVLTIFELRAAGFNFVQIRDELNRRAVPAPLSSSWNEATVRNILLREIYVGWCMWNVARPTQ